MIELVRIRKCLLVFIVAVMSSACIGGRFGYRTGFGDETKTGVYGGPY